MRPSLEDRSPSLTARQPWPTIALHWFTVLALVIAVAAIWWREALDDKVVRDTLLAAHRQLGVLIWLALLARLLAKGLLPRVDASAPMPLQVRFAAALSHWALYAALFVQPLLGWVMTNAHGQPMRFLGLVDLPKLVDADPDLADLWADRHETLAWVLGGLIALHIAAALWHHFYLRDGVLRSIMPRPR